MTDTLPHDPAAERAVVSSVLASQLALETADRVLDATDFYDPGLGHVYDAAVAVYAVGGVVDVHTVSARLVDKGLLDTVGGPKRLVQLLASAQVRVRNIEAHAGRVVEMRARRDVAQIAREATEAVSGGIDAHDAAETAIDRLRRLGGVDLTQPPADLHQFEEWIESEESRSEWVIPGLMRVDWRLMITAPPGVGKTTLTRQIAYAAAVGMQPFRMDQIPQVRTLLIDLENPVSAVRDTGRKMVTAAGQLFENVAREPAQCVVWSRREGINIRDRRDRLELERRILHTRPELVVIGPVYKSFRKDSRMQSDEITEEVCRILDDLRTRYRFALILEHHSKRDSADLFPFGSSVWERWPEFGRTLREDERDPKRIVVGRFRRDRVPVRWPSAFTWGNVWPFEAEWDREL